MSYRIYHTSAYILERIPYKEHAVLVCAFTKTLGTVWMIVEGYALPQSKLRGHIQPYSHVSLELIRGKHMWRVVGARRGMHVLDHHSMHQKIWAELLHSVRTFIAPEEPHTVLFEGLETFLKYGREGVSHEILYEQALMQLGHILSAGGYIESLRVQAYAHAPERHTKEQLVSDIHEALFHSHLEVPVVYSFI